VTREYVCVMRSLRPTPAPYVCDGLDAIIGFIQALERGRDDRPVVSVTVRLRGCSDTRRETVTKFEYIETQ